MLDRFREITNSIIDRSFPDLKNKKILVFVAPLRFYAFSVWLPPFLRLIVLSRRAGKLNDSELCGLIAHELCHQERYIKMGVWKYLIFTLGFLTSRKIRAAEEKATDRLTIEKGYGKALYGLSVKAQMERKNKKINELYLSLDEIRSYSESLGEW